MVDGKEPPRMFLRWPGSKQGSQTARPSATRSKAGSSKGSDSPAMSFDELAERAASPTSSLHSLEEGGGLMGSDLRHIKNAGQIVRSMNRVSHLQSESRTARMKKFASTQAESARAELLEQQREEVVNLRGKIFGGGQKKFSKETLNNFCAKLVGSTGDGQYRKVCSKSVDERCFQDVCVLGKVLSICKPLFDEIPQPEMQNLLFRFAHFQFVEEGASLVELQQPDEVLHVVIRGLLMEQRGGLETRAIKIGDAFVQAQDGVRRDGTVVDSGHVGAKLGFVAMLGCEILSFSKGELSMLHAAWDNTAKGTLWIFCDHEASQAWGVGAGWSVVEATVNRGFLVLEWLGSSTGAGISRRISLEGCSCWANESLLPGTPASAGMREMAHGFGFWLQTTSRDPKGQEFDQRQNMTRTGSSIMNNLSHQHQGAQDKKTSSPSILAVSEEGSPQDLSNKTPIQEVSPSYQESKGQPDPEHTNRERVQKLPPLQLEQINTDGGTSAMSSPVRRMSMSPRLQKTVSNMKSPSMLALLASRNKAVTTTTKVLFVAASSADKYRIMHGIRRESQNEGEGVARNQQAGGEHLEVDGGAAGEDVNEDVTEDSDEKLIMSDLRCKVEQVATNPIVGIAMYMSRQELFQHWGWNELIKVAPHAKRRNVSEGETLFHQDEEVKGLYIVREGTVSMQHSVNLTESELRFPGRDDLQLEEDLEYKTVSTTRTTTLGMNGEGATFGEERSGNKTSKHRFSLVSVSLVDALFFPWESLFPDERKSAVMFKTLHMLKENDANRSQWMSLRVRHYTVTRLFVNLGQYSHLNQKAYSGAASEVEALMKLESTFGMSARGGRSANLVQHFDVQEAEAYSRRSMEKLNFMLRSTHTPGQLKYVRSFL